MKDGVGECLCLSDDSASGAAEQTKSGRFVCWAIQPAESSRPGSLSTWHLLGLQARQAKLAMWSSSVTPAGQNGRSRCSSCAAPAWPAGKQESSESRATSLHAWFFCECQALSAT